MNQESARKIFSPAQAEVEYAKLLREIAALDAAGKNDSDEAVAVREKMEIPWLALDAAGVERMTDLSIALYENDEAK